MTDEDLAMLRVNNVLISTCRDVLGVEPMPPLETLEGQYKALGLLVAGLREELARLDMQADMDGFVAALVALQDRMNDALADTGRVIAPARDTAPEGVSQAFWDATDPRRP